MLAAAAVGQGWSHTAPFSSLSHLYFSESYPFTERKSWRPGDGSSTAHSRVPGELYCFSLKPPSSAWQRGWHLPYAWTLCSSTDQEFAPNSFCMILDFPPINLMHFPLPNFFRSLYTVCSHLSILSNPGGSLTLWV